MGGKPDKILLATHNAGKVQEFDTLLAPLGIAIESATAHDLEEPEETGTTFAENALLKARAAMQATGLPALADDSGLAVQGLHGAPGVYSARWAETPQGRDFSMAMQRIYDELGGIDETGAFDPSQGAYFVAMLALVYPDGREELFEGRIMGHLCWPPRGNQGFGYDPMFVPEEYGDTFAQMPASQKQGMSHRARAVDKLIGYLSNDN